MIFPSDFENKAGFTQIRQMVRENCLSTLGITFVKEISFLTDHEEIKVLLEQTEEMRQHLLSVKPFPAQDYLDLTGDLAHIRIEGSFLEPEQLTGLKLSLVTILQVRSYLENRSGENSQLKRLTVDVFIDETIPKEIEKIIDERSNVRDNASPALSRIRRDKISKQSLVERKIRENLKLARKSGWAPEDADITLRDGRLVIPLVSTHKRKIMGVVHDESATGQTVYLEPADVLETNNELRELDYAERREIITILTTFANRLRPEIDNLVQAYLFLGKIDFIRAKALLALTLNAMLPKVISPEPVIRWNKAVHPLLYLTLQKQKKQVVPLSLELNKEQRILIISGPNSGGKSVCLKTVGLLQYMLQCGLLIPVLDDSVTGIFKNIFIDIGDEQSLENDLSTYTSKLLNLKFFIEHVDEHSLFMIDELGTGTDPALGGPIAEAALEAMNEKKALGVITTHYSNLKLLASRMEGIINGAMLYDSARLKPLYQLKTGNPGSSFAFEIAGQIGFPENVLQRAKEKTGQSQLDFDRELQNLEVEKYELKKEKKSIRVADDFLAEMISKYQKKYDELEKNRKEILLKAKNDATKLVNDANKVIEKTIREIRETQAEKEATRKARKRIEEEKIKLESAVGSQQSAVGSQQSAVGSSESRKPRVFNSFESIQIPGKDKPVLPPLPKNSPYRSLYNDLEKKLREFELTLDLRGKRVEEAYSLLQRYIDDAILLTIPEVKILHGKGNGVLRQITRDFLSSVSEVKRYNDEVVERGGAGITVVSFRS
ncbi:MAG: endonuclease MutS2 [Syntrophothermus sp.]